MSGRSLAAEPDNSRWLEGEQRIFAFVDILGFGNEVRKLDLDPSGLPRIASALLGGWEILDSAAQSEDPGVPWKTRHGDGSPLLDRQQGAFSDCAVVSARDQPGGLDYVLVEVVDYAKTMLEAGLVLRGGVSRGLAVHRQGVFVGPAPLRAYLIERDVARYPRIVIDDDLALELLAIDSGANPVATVRQSEDGAYFLDIFTTIAFGRKGVERLRTARTTLLRGLAEAPTPETHTKWRWLAGQYNQALDCLVCCEKLDGGLPPAISLLEMRRPG